MELLSNIFLAAGALGAAIYCFVLSRRLKALSSLEGGMGAAIAVLSKQVDELSKSLNNAQQAAGNTVSNLTEQTQRAEAAATKLELLVASLHDLPPAHETQQPEPMPSRMQQVSSPRPEPTPWPTEHAHRPQVPRPAAHDTSTPPRARILRRRSDQGGQL